jgi:hypothetical protein
MCLTAFRTLGRSGLVVSPLALGIMSFGTPRWGSPDEVSEGIFNAYVDLGGNFIDTADVYANGHSEELVGGFIAGRGLRDKMVLATEFAFNAAPATQTPGATAARTSPGRWKACESWVRSRQLQPIGAGVTPLRHCQGQLRNTQVLDVIDLRNAGLGCNSRRPLRRGLAGRHFGLTRGVVDRTQTFPFNSVVARFGRIDRSKLGSIGFGVVGRRAQRGCRCDDRVESSTAVEVESARNFPPFEEGWSLTLGREARLLSPAGPTGSPGDRLGQPESRPPSEECNEPGEIDPPARVLAEA